MNCSRGLLSWLVGLVVFHFIENHERINRIENAMGTNQEMKESEFQCVAYELIARNIQTQLKHTQCTKRVPAYIFRESPVAFRLSISNDDEAKER